MNQDAWQILECGNWVINNSNSNWNGSNAIINDKIIKIEINMNIIVNRNTNGVSLMETVGSINQY